VQGFVMTELICFLIARFRLDKKEYNWD